MKKAISPLLLSILILATSVIHTQSPMPAYPDVVKKFFTEYSYIQEEPYDRMNFSKKKEGWFVRVADQLHDNRVKSDQLYWSLAENKYMPVIGFGAGVSAQEADSLAETFMLDGGSPSTYEFERCQYYAYKEWDVDMIRDFGKSMPANDTLLEGLARAYGTYGGRYLWDGQTGNPLNDELLGAALGYMEKPGQRRIDSFIHYSNKSIDCYRELAERNPYYQTRVGTVGMKLINEETYQYQELLMSGNRQQAISRLNSINENDSIYLRIGHNYLSACPPNAILITFGDNDTYPLWYTQEKHGFRKDVTVINYSLMGLAPYINMLKQEKMANFATDLTKFGKTTFTYSVFDGLNASHDKSQSLAALLNDLLTIKYPYTESEGTIASFHNKNVTMTVDLPRLKKICNQSNLSGSINIELGTTLLLNDLLFLDILNQNLYTRPVCGTVELELFPKKYWQQEGSVFRLLPLDDKQPGIKAKMEIAKAENYLQKNYKPVILTYGKKNRHYENAVRGLPASIYNRLIRNYLSLHNNVAAKKWAAMYIASPERKIVAIDFSDYELGETLLEAGYTEEGINIFENIANWALSMSTHYTALEPYYAKRSQVGTLQYLQSILATKGLQSQAVDKILDQLTETH